MFLSFPKNCEVKGIFAIHHDLFDISFQNHTADTLKSVFKDTFTFFYRCDMAVE